MTALKSDKMTADDFLERCLTQEECYELVDGVPRLRLGDGAYASTDPRMMTGARKVHDRVMRNSMYALMTQLRASRCEPFSNDIAIRNPTGQIRRADVVVGCGPSENDELQVTSPVFIIEILSKSTRQMDLHRRTAEYKTLPSLRYILLIDPVEVAAIFHVRQADGRWEDIPLIGRETEIPMPEINVSLTLGEFYEGLNV